MVIGWRTSRCDVLITNAVVREDLELGFRARVASSALLNRA